MKNIILGIFSTLAIAIIGRIILYFIIVYIEKIYTRYFIKPNYKIIVKNILEHLSNNKQFISDVSQMIYSDNRTDDIIYKNIISLNIVQDFIQSEIDSSKIKLDKFKIEDHLKLIFAKHLGSIVV
jgi:hypothetical protein